MVKGIEPLTGNKNIRNAFGNVVELVSLSVKDRDYIVTKLAVELASIEGVDGVMLVGSTNEHVLDSCMDVDLRIFCENDAAQYEVNKTYKNIGANTDDLRSVFSPFDTFCYMFGNACVETEIHSLIQTRQKIIQILSGCQADEGLIHSIQKGRILYDNQEMLLALKKEVENLEYSDDLVQYCIKTYGAVSLKLLLHSIIRRDYSFAIYWVYRVFLDTTKILFSKNRVFFPGRKRLLTTYVPKLSLCPKGYIDFWNDIFMFGVQDWEKTYEIALDYMLRIKADGFVVRTT